MMHRIVFIIAVCCPLLASALPIWEAKGPSHITLIGTLHVLPKSAYPLPSPFARALGQCDSLWVEVNDIELQNPDTQAMMQAIIRLPDGQTLRDTLSQSAYRQLAMAAEKVGLSLVDMEPFKAWMIMTQIGVMLFQQQGFSPELGLDSHLQALARAQNLPIHAFESAQWQFEMLDRIGSQNPDKFVYFSTIGLNEPETLIRRMYTQWYEGDVEQLYADSGLSLFPDINNAILTQRNQAWLADLDNLNAYRRPCVAVGALHMAGPNSLLRGLEARGFTVTHARQSQ